MAKKKTGKLVWEEDGWKIYRVTLKQRSGKEYETFRINPPNKEWYLYGNRASPHAYEVLFLLRKKE